MIDTSKLGETRLKKNGKFSQLKTLLKLLGKIYREIQFTRLAVDRFDLLSEDRRLEKVFLFHLSHVLLSR
jgi:hypothetical protein